MSDNIFSESPEKVVQALTKRTLIVALFFLGSAAVSGRIDALLGLVFGLSISLLLFRLKLTHCRRAVEMGKSEASRFIRNRMIINFFIFFIVLAAAHWQPGLDLLGAVLGLLLLKFTILASALLETVRSLFKKKSREYASPLSEKGFSGFDVREEQPEAEKGSLKFEGEKDNGKGEYAKKDAGFYPGKQRKHK